MRSGQERGDTGCECEVSTGIPGSQVFTLLLLLMPGLADHLEVIPLSGLLFYLRANRQVQVRFASLIAWGGRFFCPMGYNGAYTMVKRVSIRNV